MESCNDITLALANGCLCQIVQVCGIEMDNTLVHFVGRISLVSGNYLVIWKCVQFLSGFRTQYISGGLKWRKHNCKRQYNKQVERNTNIDFSTLMQTIEIQITKIDTACLLTLGPVSHWKNYFIWRVTLPVKLP